MPFFPTDYLADTVDLTTLEHGAYFLLILHYWREEGLPNDDRKLARIARMSERDWTKARDTLRRFFMPDWRHGRIEAELIKAKASYERRAAAGKRGGSAARASPSIASALSSNPSGSGSGSGSGSFLSSQEDILCRDKGPTK